MPTPPPTTSSTSSNALGACASPQWPYTISARSLVSIAPRRPPLSIPVHGRCLATAPALVRGRCLLPPHLSMALAAPRGRHGELRRAHHPALDAEISHQQGLHHHPQQVHALRETVLGLRPGQRPFPERARHAGQLELARPGGAAGAAGVA